MDAKNDSQRQYKKYLLDYINKTTPESAPDDLLFKLEYYTLNEDDVIGECLAICQQELKECPQELARHVSWATLERVQKHGIKPWLCAPIAEEEFCDDESSSDTVKISDDNSLTTTPAPSPRLLRMEKFMFDVLQQLYDICRTWGEELPSFVTEHGGAGVPEMTAHGVRNTRRKMEDRHITVTHLDDYLAPKNPEAPEKTVHYYGVFDGHGGVEAAIYSAANLHVNLAQDREFFTDRPAAIKRAFEKTDQGFVVKSQHEKLRSGCTALIMTLEGKRLHVAWCGDSQALLVKSGCYQEVMEPHKPEREDEKKRIEDLGGCVVWFGVWRVNGTLSVSRAIGDAMYKPYVSAEPDITTIDLQGDEEYMVLACDGLWDTVTPRELVTHVYDYVQKCDRKQLAMALIELARDNGSSDNITVMVVFLKDQISPPNLPPEEKATEDASEGIEKEDEPEKEPTVKEEESESEKEEEKKNKDELMDGGDAVVNKGRHRDDDDDKGHGGQSPMGGKSGQGNPGCRNFSSTQEGQGQSGGSPGHGGSDQGDCSQQRGSCLQTISEQSEESVTHDPRVGDFLHRLVEDIKFIDETDEESACSGEQGMHVARTRAVCNVGADQVKIEEIAIDSMCGPLILEESSETDSPVNVPATTGLGSGDSISSAMGLTIESGEKTSAEPIQSDASTPLEGSESRSSLSQDGLALMAQTANRCLSARRSKRARNAHRRNNKDDCRPGRDKATVTTQTTPTGTKRHNSRNNSSTASRRASQQRKYSGTELVGMLTGLGHQNTYRPRFKANRGQWTVAVEIDANEILQLENLQNIKHGRKY